MARPWPTLLLLAFIGIAVRARTIAKRSIFLDEEATPVFASVSFDCAGKNDGHYAAGPGACQRIFFVCLNGVSVKRLCPAGLFYDQPSTKCLFKAKVAACNGTPVPKPQPTPVVTPPLQHSNPPIPAETGERTDAADVEPNEQKPAPVQEPTPVAAANADKDPFHSAPDHYAPQSPPQYASTYGKGPYPIADEDEYSPEAVNEVYYSAAHYGSSAKYGPQGSSAPDFSSGYLEFPPDHYTPGEYVEEKPAYIKPADEYKPDYEYAAPEYGSPPTGYAQHEVVDPYPVHEEPDYGPPRPQYPDVPEQYVIEGPSTYEHDENTPQHPKPVPHYGPPPRPDNTPFQSASISVVTTTTKRSVVKPGDEPEELDVSSGESELTNDTKKPEAVMKNEDDAVLEAVTDNSAEVDGSGEEPQPEQVNKTRVKRSYYAPYEYQRYYQGHRSASQTAYPSIPIAKTQSDVSGNKIGYHYLQQPSSAPVLNYYRAAGNPYYSADTPAYYPVYTPAVSEHGAPPAPPPPPPGPSSHYRALEDDLRSGDSGYGLPNPIPAISKPLPDHKPPRAYEIVSLQN